MSADGGKNYMLAHTNVIISEVNKVSRKNQCRILGFARARCPETKLKVKVPRICLTLANIWPLRRIKICRRRQTLGRHLNKKFTHHIREGDTRKKLLICYQSNIATDTSTREPKPLFDFHRSLGKKPGQRNLLNGGYKKNVYLSQIETKWKLIEYDITCWPLYSQSSSSSDGWMCILQSK